MKKFVFYSKFWLIPALFLFIITVSGTISPVSGQFDFGDDSEDSSNEKSSDEESSDEGGFSFGDDESESDSSEKSDSDSDGGFSFGEEADSDAETEKTEDENEVSGEMESDEEVKSDESEVSEEMENADNPDEKKNSKSAAKAAAVEFVSNGSTAGEEATLKLHGVEYRFRWCPAGSFQMGSSMKELKRNLNEKQMEAVIPHGFWMLETEVTMQMFASFVRQTGYKTDAERDSVGAYHVDVESGQILGPEPGFSWKKTGIHMERNFPVTNITWYDAQKFVEWINTEISTHEDPVDSKRQARLPSETQWEYACRAGNPGMYGCGDKMGDLVNHANLREVNQNVTLVKTDVHKFTPWSLPVRQEFRYCAPVAGRTPNAWGLFDMHGNVWEWCDDGYADYEQALVPSENSSDLQKFIGRVGPAVRGLKVVRGGGWNTDYHQARSASRGSNPPSRRFVALGFRFIILPMEVEKEKNDSEEDEATVSTDSLFGGDDDEDSAKEEKNEDSEEVSEENSEEAGEDAMEDAAKETSEETSEKDAEENEESSGDDGGFDF